MTLPVTYSPGYVVSSDPRRIELCDEDTPGYYNTPEEAGAAIKEGYHGEAGTRYVLAVTTSVAAVWDRPWTLVPRTDADVKAASAGSFAETRVAEGF